MKCPMKNTFQDNDDNMPEEYSEWNLYCQDCKHFEECTMTLYNNLTGGKEQECGDCGQCEKCKQKSREKAYDETKGYGDNFPTYVNIHLRILLHQERCKIIEKALLEGLGKITKDDITDWTIDVELYNAGCRKEKIKRQYKKKEKPQ